MTDMQQFVQGQTPLTGLEQSLQQILSSQEGTAVKVEDAAAKADEAKGAKKKKRICYSISKQKKWQESLQATTGQEGDMSEYGSHMSMNSYEMAMARHPSSWSLGSQSMDGSVNGDSYSHSHQSSITSEDLAAPLPPGWRVDTAPNGSVYYINDIQQITTWTDPRTVTPPPPTMEPTSADWESFPLPEGWEQSVAANGSVYFIDHNTQQTSWIDPRQQILSRMTPEERMHVMHQRKIREDLERRRLIVEQQQRMEMEMLAKQQAQVDMQLRAQFSSRASMGHLHVPPPAPDQLGSARSLSDSGLGAVAAGTGTLRPRSSFQATSSPLAQNDATIRRSVSMPTVAGPPMGAYAPTLGVDDMLEEAMQYPGVQMAGVTSPSGRGGTLTRQNAGAMFSSLTMTGDFVAAGVAEGAIAAPPPYLRGAGESVMLGAPDRLGMDDPDALVGPLSPSTVAEFLGSWC